MFDVFDTTPLNFSNEIVLFNEGARMVLEAMDEFQPISMFEDYMTEAFGKNKTETNDTKKPDEKAPAGNKVAEKFAKGKKVAADTKEKEEANEKASEKTRSGFMKIVDAIMNMIRKIRDSIGEFFDKRKLDAAQKEAYESFKIACQKDPALKNKKITVANWKKIDAEYKEYINECQKRLELLKKDEKTPIQDLIDRGKKLTTGAIKGSVISVGATSVMAMASTDRQTAQFLRNLLNSENAAMESIRKEMGKKQYKKMDKELKKMSRALSFHRMIIEYTGQHYDNYKDALLSPLRTIKSWAKVGSGETELNKENIKDLIEDRTGRQLLGNIARNKGIRDATGATVGRAAKMGVRIGVKGALSGAQDKASYLLRKLTSPTNAANKNVGQPDTPTAERRSRLVGRTKDSWSTAFTKSGGGSVRQQKKRKKREEAAAAAQQGD